jgi:hypothetical protein
VTETKHNKIMVLNMNGKVNGLKKHEEFGIFLTNHLNGLYKSAISMDTPDIKSQLRAIVPEYQPDLSKTH